MISKLVLSGSKVKLAMANACLDPFELCEKAEIHYTSFLRVTKGQAIKPATAGKIAKTLGKSVEDLLED